MADDASRLQADLQPRWGDGFANFQRGILDSRNGIQARVGQQLKIGNKGYRARSQEFSLICINRGIPVYYFDESVTWTMGGKSE